MTDTPTLFFKPWHIPLIFTDPPGKWQTMRTTKQKTGAHRILLAKALYGIVNIQLHEDYLQPCFYFDVQNKEEFAKAEGYLSLDRFEIMLYGFSSHGHFCYRPFLEGSKPMFIYRITEARRINP